MTCAEFATLAPRLVTEDVLRPKLQQPWRTDRRTYATDARFALIFDSCVWTAETEAAAGAAKLTQTLESMAADIDSFTASARCETVELDVARLRAAIRATYDDLAKSEMFLHTYEPDDSDPDDEPRIESVRWMRSVFSRVILPDRRRTVLAGYYAEILADMLDTFGVKHICVPPNVKRAMPICATGDNWRLLIMPIYCGDGRPPYLMPAAAVADAATGELVHHYEGGQVDCHRLRFPAKGGAQ